MTYSLQPTPLAKALAKTSSSALITLGAVLALAGPALAEQDDSSERANSSDAALERVVVTAQRREETAQDVGVAISVLGGEKLADKGITQVNQLQNATPSLEIEPAFGGGQPQFRIRGVGFQDYASNNSPTVGIYLDEVAQPFPIGTQGLLFDLERVEVLRGPQGTLYGRNSTAGAVNFLVERPTSFFETGFNTRYGSYNAWDGEGYVSGPLTDNLRARLAVASSQGGGWQKHRDTGQSLGDRDRNAIRGQLEWDASERTHFRLLVSAYEDRSEANGLYLFNDFASQQHGLIPADRHRNRTGWSVRPEFARLVGEPGLKKPGRDNSGNTVTLHGSFDLGNSTLSSITSANRIKRRELNDWDASSAHESDVFFRSDAKVFSQELRLASNSDGPLDWLGGLYYSREKLDEKFFSDFNDLGWGFPGTRTTYTQDADTVGVFGQLGYQLNPRLKLIAGLRYEDESRELNDLVTANLGTGQPFAEPLDRKTSLDEFSGKLGLEFQAAPDTLLYASVSRGVKSGGFTAYNGSDPRRADPFKFESLIAYEVGFKSDLSRTLRLNGSAFFYDYQDQQVLDAYLGPTGVIGKITNAPKSEIYGLELELEWLPLSGLSITQALGYKEGKYRKFTALDVAATQASGYEIYRDLSGEDLNFPNLSYQGSVAYRWRAGGLNLTAEADYSYRDAYNSWLGKAYDLDGYWLANARLEFAPQGSPWAVAVWGRNIFNEKYDLTRNFFVNAQVALAGEPATYGLQVKYSY